MSRKSFVIPTEAKRSGGICGFARSAARWTRRPWVPHVRIFGRGILLRALAILIVAVITMGAADNATRYNDLGHKMMCACGCGQVLIECNHFGCPDSDRMLGELRLAISKGGSDDSILASFQDKYGPTILAAPLLTKFNLIAWIVPPAVLILGIAGTIVLIRRWRQRAAVLQAAALQAAADAAPQPHLDAMRERIRRETEL